MDTEEIECPCTEGSHREKGMQRRQRLRLCLPYPVGSWCAHIPSGMLMASSLICQVLEVSGFGTFIEVSGFRIWCHEYLQCIFT